MKTPNKISILEQLKLLRGRVTIQQVPKIQSNKRLYKRDVNKNWKKDS